MLAAAAAALVQGFAGSARPSHASLGSARSAVSMATGNPIGAILEKMGIDIPGPDVSGLPPQGVVITGGAGGVGYAYADSFMARGHNVVICDVKDPEAAVAALQQKHAGGSGKVYGCVCDVSKTESVEELGRFAKEKLGTINHWINNAGINGGRRPFTSVPTSMVEAVVNVNLVGVLLCTKVALEIMQQQAGVESHIFNTVGSGVKGGGTPGCDLPCLTPQGRASRGAGDCAKAHDVRSFHPGQVCDLRRDQARAAATHRLAGRIAGV